MFDYFHTKLHVSSIILIDFRKEDNITTNPVPIEKRNPKSPCREDLKIP